MNDELQKQLAQLLAKLMEYTDDAAKFAGNQIPPLVQEKIIFGRAWETTLCLLFLSLLVFGGYWSQRLWQKAATEDWDGDVIFASIFASALWAAGFRLWLMTGYDFLMVWCAPSSVHRRMAQRYGDQVTRKHSGPQPGGRATTVRITCRKCTQAQHAPKLSVWPVPCLQCHADVAPAWWFRERGQALPRSE